MSFEDVIRAARLRPLRTHALALAFQQLQARPDPMWWKLLHDFVSAGEREWCRAPELAAIGHALLGPGYEADLRVWACQWLTHFPSLETVARLREVLEDPRAPRELRDQAAWTLSYRQVQERDDAFFISSDVERAADDALLAQWDRGAWTDLPQLVSGARHSRDTRLFERMAASDFPLEIAARALEAFATPALARRLLGSLRLVPDGERVRMVRLIGATLERECVPPLLAFARDADIGVRVEALFTAFAIDADAARDVVRAFLDSLSLRATFDARARWHDEHPGVLPLVRALRTARVSATLDARERGARAASASADFAALGAIEPFAERYLTDLWCHMAFAAQSVAPAEVIRCVDAVPSALDIAPFLLEPFLESLARMGRFRRLMSVARQRAAHAEATWLFARFQRPYLAFAARRATRRQTVRSLAGETLALCAVGRRDLAEFSLIADVPAAEPLWGTEAASPFPGPDEGWRCEFDPGRDVVLEAVVRCDLDALIALRDKPPEDADDDIDDDGALDALIARLEPDLAGKSVVLIGEFRNEEQIREWLERCGAIVASGPFAKVQYHCVGRKPDLKAVAEVEARGSIRITLPVALRAGYGQT